VSRKTLSLLLFVCGVLSLAIAVYQFTGSRAVDGVFSVVFSVVFLAGAVANRAGSAR
jgi:hypothetical protein